MTLLPTSTPDEPKKVWEQLSTGFQERAVLIVVQMAINCMVASTQVLISETAHDSQAKRSEGAV
jgi:hypothetical protein